MKSHIINAIQQIYYATGVSSLLAKRSSVGRIIMLHGVGDDAHLASVFEQQVKFLTTHFNVISLDQMLAMSQAGQPFTNELVLTFDDGLRNNLTHAYPILKKYKAPATFFVCPGLVEKGNWLWNHEARERLYSLTPDQTGEIAKSLNCANDAESIVACMKALDIDTRQSYTNEIRKLTPAFTPSDAQRVAYDMMSWDDLRGIDSSLVTIGSHTTNHVIAKNLSETDLATEIADSKTILEDQLDRSVDHFCYPNGDYDEQTVREVRNTYRSAVTTKEGVVLYGADNFLFNRIPSANSASYLAWRLYRPAS